MDYAFCRLTKYKEDMNYTDVDTMWLPLDKITSLGPAENGTIVTYFNGVSHCEVLARETTEGIFNSVVFVKSPTTYYVDPNDSNIPNIS